MILYHFIAREELGKEKLQNLYNDSYWEQHYSIVRERIPRFLEPFAEKILNTGKCLNVITNVEFNFSQAKLNKLLITWALIASQPFCFLSVEQTQAILFLKSMSDRGGSVIERL